MRRGLLTMIFLLMGIVGATATDYVPRDLVWTSQSPNASASMPCGGHDVGLNVWVERGDLLMYAAQSGWFDENNTLLKAGRWRLHLDGKPFDGDDFCQRLCLDDGAVYITGRGVTVRIWVDVEQPTVCLEVASRQSRAACLSYESWRWRDRPITKAECQQCSYKWILPTGIVTHADSITAQGSTLTFTHTNAAETVFGYTVAQQQLDALRDSLYDPLGHRRMRGEMTAPGFTFTGTRQGTYGSTDHRAWQFCSPRLRRSTITITLSNGDSTVAPTAVDVRTSRRRSAAWWHAFWQRSWIVASDSHPEAQHMARNYELTRYLLGCNAYGQWPMKFNGGLFTFDPEWVEAPNDDGTATNPFTPDYRKWGGGTMTAQNQRLVYWPMLKSGDYDMMDAQLGTYLRMLPTAVARTRHYWGHGGASFTEQIENFGLPNPAEYGKHPEGSDPGVERNVWLEYEWDTALEFCMMALEAQRYGYNSRHDYTPLVEECLRFFDEHYQYLARRMGAKALNDSSQLVIYPGSACETYKMAYNPSSTIAALKTVASRLPDGPLPLQCIPDIPLRTIGGDTCIAPAVAWARIQNTETPQLYPVFPWRVYGLGRPGLHIAVNTYLHDPHALAMRSAKGWKQDNIWAACLGLTDEARSLNSQKFADGPYRFPAFWEPGFDWAPDLNRGGAAMIGLQEMLLQESPEGELLLFPAWPREWDARFRLHASGGRLIEATLTGGQVTHTVVQQNEKKTKKNHP